MEPSTCHHYLPPRDKEGMLEAVLTPGECSAITTANISSSGAGRGCRRSIAGRIKNRKGVKKEIIAWNTRVVGGKTEEPETKMGVAAVYIPWKNRKGSRNSKKVNPSSQVQTWFQSKKMFFVSPDKCVSSSALHVVTEWSKIITKNLTWQLPITKLVW